jgi:hypothetical protein
MKPYLAIALAFGQNGAQFAIAQQTSPLIAIAKVNNSPILAGSSHVEVAPPWLVLDGVADLQTTSRAEYEVVLLEGSAQEDRWRLLDEPVTRLSGAGSVKWRLGPYPLNYSWQHSFRAALRRKGAPPSLGLYNEELLRRTMIATSEPLVLDVKQVNPATPVAVPRVRLEKIGLQKIAPGSVLNVGQDEIVECRVQKPAGTFAQVIVRPVGIQSAWAMHAGSNSLTTDGLLSGTTFFGRDGLDAFKEFLVFCVVTDRALPNRELSPDEWLRYEKRLLATSNQARVIRIDPPFNPKTEVNLQITHLHLIEVDSNKEWRVPARSSISGTASGRGIARGEEVWLFRVPPENTSDNWLLLGRASVKNDRSWEFAPIQLGKIGQRWSLIAVLASARPDGLLDSRIVTRSKRVNVVVFPEVRVGIARVCSQPVGAAAEISIQSLCTVEIDVDADVLTGAETVAAYGRSQTDKTWKLIRKALPAAGGRYETFPTDLGQPGDVISIVAVVSDRTIPNLNDDDLARVIAFSRPVRVHLKEQEKRP